MTTTTTTTTIISAVTTIITTYNTSTSAYTWKIERYFMTRRLFAFTAEESTATVKTV